MQVNPKNNSRLSRRHFLRGLGAVAAGLTFFPREGWSAEEKSAGPKMGHLGLNLGLKRSIVNSFDIG